MTLDLVIVSDAKTPALHKITQDGINSATKYTCTVDVNPIVIEKQNVSYINASTFRQQGEFNYNKYLNYGASLGKGDYIAFCNNDLIFEPLWNEIIISSMIDHNLDSASPYSFASHNKHKTGIKPNSGVIKGYTVKHQFEGWCFVWKRSLWEEIKLDERVKFWCSDDATAEQLKAAGKTHALVTDCHVEHLDNGGKTLATVPDKRYEYTTEQAKIFNRLYDKNVENAGK